jgi:hypothetical protein
MFPMLEEIVGWQQFDRERQAAKSRFVAAAQTDAHGAPRGLDWSQRLQAIRRMISPRVGVDRESGLPDWLHSG